MALSSINRMLQKTGFQNNFWQVTTDSNKNRSEIRMHFKYWVLMKLQELRYGANINFWIVVLA